MLLNVKFTVWCLSFSAINLLPVIISDFDDTLYMNAEKHFKVVK